MANGGKAQIQPSCDIRTKRSENLGGHQEGREADIRRSPGRGPLGGLSGRSAANRCDCSMTTESLAAAARGALRRGADHGSGH